MLIYISLFVCHLCRLDNDRRRHATDVLDRNPNLSGRSGSYADNALWPGHHASALSGSDPRLQPNANPLYGKSAAVLYDQSAATVPCSDEAVSRPDTWTSDGDIAAVCTSGSQQPARTPGRYWFTIC